MSDQNLRHWSALSRTDPKHTKPFQRSGGFKGTATRPIWIEMRLTQHFGPCGIGWGCDAPEFTLVPAADEILVFCTLRCWYMDGETRGEVYGVGGDKVLVKQQSGLRADDEAYKKAFTDALGNAFKHVGSNADIHMGLFEDSKYRAEVAREFAEGSDAEPAGGHNPAARAPAAGNGAAPHQVPTGGQLPPPSPEEPPEVGLARAEMKGLLQAFRDAADETAITAIWQGNPTSLERIRRHGGEAAFNRLSAAAQERLDSLRQGDAA